MREQKLLLSIVFVFVTWSAKTFWYNFSKFWIKKSSFRPRKTFRFNKTKYANLHWRLIKTKMALKSWLYWCIGVRNQIAFEYFPLIHSSTWLTTLSIIIILRIDAAEILYLHKWPDFRLPLYSFLMKKEHDILEQKRDAC